MNRNLVFAAVFLTGALCAVPATKERAERSAPLPEIRSTEIPSNQSVSPIRVFLVPHHLVAEDMIHDMFSQAAHSTASSLPARIILVSPNHFSNGVGRAITADRIQGLGQSEILVDTRSIEVLEREGQLSNEPSVLRPEHGIKNLLPFVKEYFPGIPLLPIVVRDEMSLRESLSLARALHALPGESLLILSSDFSHTLDPILASFHDEATIAALRTFSVEKFSALDTDCVPGLALLSSYAQLSGASSFTLRKNSNSGYILRNDVAGETTSYITGFFSKASSFESAPEKSPVHFLAVGKTGRQSLQKEEMLQRLWWSQEENFFQDNPISSELRSGYTREGVRFVAEQLTDEDRFDRLMKSIPNDSDIPLVVFLEWGAGDTHFSRREKARALVDRGADLILGEGTPSPAAPLFETYRGVPLFFSLNTASDPALSSPRGVLVVGFSFRGEELRLFPSLLLGEPGYPIRFAPTSVREAVFERNGISFAGSLAQ